MDKTGSGVEFHLSDEILSVIPTDPYDLLDLARKITSMAISSRVSKLESENGKLRQTIYEKDKTISDLQDQISDLDRKFRDSESRLRIALEENGRLIQELDMLVLTTKKLGKDLSKLEAFKRQLMQSLSDDKSSEPAESIDIATYDQSIARGYSSKDEASISHRGSDTVSAEIGEPILEASGSSGKKFSLSPYITPQLAPSVTPTASPTACSPKGYSTAAGSSPKIWSGSSSPTKSRFEGHSSSSSLYTSTPCRQSSASSSPPPGPSLSGRAPRMEGKEFFRQARSRLSLEQFGAFLANIKELNAHRQSHEQTLEKAEEILGTDNKDLYISFRRMLYRNLP